MFVPRRLLRPRIGVHLPTTKAQFDLSSSSIVIRPFAIITTTNFTIHEYINVIRKYDDKLDELIAYGTFFGCAYVGA